MELKMRCGCGQLNNPELNKCEKCGASLRFATEEYEEENFSDQSDCPETDSCAEQPGTEDLKRTVLQKESKQPEKCGCKGPILDPETGECGRCDGIPDENSAKSSNDSDSVTESIKQTAPDLIIDGHKFNTENGVLLGRDIDSVTLEMYKLLNPYTGVSRQHLWLIGNTDEVLLLDLGSRNGTWLEGQRLQPFKVHRLSNNLLPQQLWIGGKLKIDIEKEA